MPEKNIKQRVISILDSILPRAIKRKLFHLGFNLDRTEFAKFAYLYARAPNMRLGLERARSRGLQPGTIVDIGAFEGDWSRMARDIWPDARIIMVEGNEDKQPALEAVARQVDAGLHIQLLGADSDSAVTFHVMESGSSVFEENSPLERETRTVKTRALDDLMSGEAPGFIKIDVQGYELEVLRGATRSLASAEAVLLEVSLLQINQGAPLLSDVVAFMDAAGFAAADVLEIHRRPLDQATNQVDLMFVRKSSPLMTDTRHF